MGARRVIKYSTLYPFRLAHPAPVHSPVAPQISRAPAGGDGNRISVRAHLSVCCRICWVQRAGGVKGFSTPARRTEHGVWWAPPAPERETWRPPRDADGWRRDGPPNGVAQDGSIPARADKPAGRPDRRRRPPRPATGHDATRRGPPRPRRWLWAGLLPRFCDEHQGPRAPSTSGGFH